jgi:hypothetical protein
MPFLENTLTSTTTPETPGGTLNDVSLTSFAFSPNIALKVFFGRKNRSPFGVTFARQYILSFNLRAYSNNPVFIQIS